MLDNLPSEVVDLIARNFDRPTLQATRHINRQWNTICSRFLFDTIVLTPRPGGVSAWQEIIEDQSLRRLPRKAIILSFPISDGFYDKEYAGFDIALDDVARIPNLESIELHLLPRDEFGVSENVYGGDVRAPHREETMQAFLTGLEKRQKEKDAQKLLSLTITDLQNSPLYGTSLIATTWSIIREALKSVERLCLVVGEEESDTIEFGHSIMLEQIPSWLGAVSARLKVLTLYYCSGFWGSLATGFDGSGLQLPVLESITVAGYCLSYYDDADWILRQKNLLCLRLHDCVISSYALVKIHWGHQISGWSRMPAGTFGIEWFDRGFFHYPGDWAEIFLRIRAELTNLEDFRFDFSTSDSTAEVEASWRDPHLLGVQLSPLRYTAGIPYMETCPLKWKQAESSGHLPIGDNGEGVNLHALNAVNDQIALDALLQELQKRRAQEQVGTS